MTYLVPFAGDDRPRAQHPVHVALERAAKKAAQKKDQSALLVKAPQPPEFDPNKLFLIDGMPPSLRQILVDVCREHQVTPLEVRSPDSRKHVVQARRVFSIRAREETQHSVTRIANCINKDHTTVLYFLKQERAGCSLRPVFPRSKHPSKSAQRTPKLTLTESEARCLALYAEGLTTKEVAARMGVSDSAARNTRGRASRKMALIKAKESGQ